MGRIRRLKGAGAKLVATGKQAGQEANRFSANKTEMDLQVQDRTVRRRRRSRGERPLTKGEAKSPPMAQERTSATSAVANARRSRCRIPSSPIAGQQPV